MTGNDSSSVPNEATVRVSRSGSESKITVAGHVAVASSPFVRSALLSLIRQRTCRGIIIDLSEVSYLDTSGIATLLEALSSAHEYSVRLCLIGLSGQPRSL